MNKIIQKVFAVLATLTSIITLCFPVYAEETESYFSFNKDSVVLHVGDEYTIQFEKSDDVEIKESSIQNYDENVIDYDSDLLTVTAKSSGNASVLFTTSIGNFTFYVTVTDQQTPSNFKWNKNSYTFTTRNLENNYFSLDYNVEPYDAFRDIAVSIDDPDSVVQYFNGSIPIPVDITNCS